MFLKASFLVAGIITAGYGYSQSGTPPGIDTTVVDYETLYNELEALIDSLTAPRSYTIINVSMGKGFFSYENKTTFQSTTKLRTTFAPTIGYYGKSGIGIQGDASIIHDGSKINPYQFSVCGSYDYQKNKKFITGVSVTHFFTRKNLPFYTSPLQNDLYGYFTYRKLWVKPSVGLSYGWGSRSALEEREEQIQGIQLAKRGFTRINTEEKILDFNITASVRHDFYFMELLGKNDYVRITPQFSFASGTQQFGFNQTSNTYATLRQSGANILFYTDNTSLDDKLYFQPLSVTAYLKTEYTAGKFFIAPQLMVDYYFPVTKDHVSTTFFISLGFLL